MANMQTAGIVTAYGAAVRGGYTGTYEDFCRQQAQYAESSAAVEQAKQDAQEAQRLAETAQANAETAQSAAEQAKDSAETAQSGAETARTGAEDAQSAAETARTGAETAQNAAETARTGAETAQTGAEAAEAHAQQIAESIPEDYTALSEKVDQNTAALETKAEIDGYYEDMTVGDAEQLVSTKYVDDSEPYKYRTTGGSADVGNRAYIEKIIGGTVAWNQLARSIPTYTHNGVTFTRNEDGSYTVNGTAENSAYFGLTNATIPNHVYLTIAVISGENVYAWQIGYGTHTGAEISKRNGSNAFGLIVKSGETADNVKAFLNVFDLTQMFGSAIADYIYSLDQANAGAGVALFRSWFPEPYYEYNAGELISVEGLQSRKTVGFNQWDEEWEVGAINGSNGQPVSSTTAIRSKNYVPVIGGKTYLINTDFTVCCGYDANKNFITTVPWRHATPGGCYYWDIPIGVAYVRFGIIASYGTTYKNDICINLSWSGTRNGEYAAYEGHEYPLDSSLTLRGIPKLVDGEVKWDGDEYLPEGKVVRKYGIVDMGTLNWAYRAANNNIFTTTLAGVNGKIRASIICPKYIVHDVTYPSLADKEITSASAGIDENASMVLIKDSAYTTGAEFKTAMSGVYLLYELATPTEEEANHFTEVQIVNDWGTEEFISNSIVPVGHETRYPANLRDKLQHLPDMASGDGNYLIEQNGSQMTLVPFRIPKAPTSPDGVYTLKATVSGGTPTYTWEAEE